MHSLSYGALFSGLGLLIGGLGLWLFVVLPRRQQNLGARLNELRRDYVVSDGIDDGSEASKPQDMLQSGLISILDILAEELGRFNWTNGEQQEKLRGLLLQAGIRRADGPRLLMAIKVVALVVIGLVGVLVSAVMDVSSSWWAVAGLGGGLGGALLPEMALKKYATRRLARITQRLPDALDLLIIFANAGFGMDQALLRLSQEMRRNAPDLSEELAVTSDELRVLADRSQALENMAARTQIKAVRGLVSTINQAQKYGTPLTQALRVLATEERNERITELEERAGRMPVLITVPLVSFILPAVMLLIGTPAFIQAGHALPRMFGGDSH